jgi:hypothetical protein
MLYEQLRRAIGEPNHYAVSDIAGWCVGMIGSLGQRGGRALFEELSYPDQQVIIRKFAALQYRYTDRHAQQAALLMQLHLMAAADGDEDLADSIYAYITAHAATMVRFWRRRCAMN